MDWPKLIAELQAADKTQADIARACGCAQPTISEIARGRIREPGYSLGEALIAFHAAVTEAA